MTAPVVVAGAGAAGLAVARALAPVPVVLLAPGRLGGGTSTGWAQGGLAAALDPADSPARHAADTEAVGGGLVDPAVARAVARAAPERIADLVALGAAFDRHADGTLALGLEAGHSHRRIVRAQGDGTGATVLAPLIAAVRRAGHVTVREGVRATGVAVGDAGVRGAILDNGDVVPARAVVLATGGVGGLFATTTNPLGATGQGLALATRAGARARNPEFVQVPPTALDVPADPAPLASEALRGEGVPLVTAGGAPVVRDHPAGALAPRDVVARAVHAERARGGTAYLDTPAALGPAMAARFPGVTRAARAVGLDPVSQPLPVRPAAHFHVGGVAADVAGASDVPGLYAVGEVAATGLHGANRLAGNGVMEGLAMAPWTAAHIRASAPADPRPPRAAPAGDTGAPATWLRRWMGDACGPWRERARLTALLHALDGEAGDAALTARLIARGALARTETRGGHARADHPAADPAQARDTLLNAAPQPEAAA